ncbi:S9 family peptidase [Tepidibacillus sp. HK-1]|uniref:S9 family peptidase n=1 Tax=Tepidibacillus sp. HK-1 TaxID=1883407 RepID=UPI000853E718|nr:S9 family peptidase [Tepidibacillus sp. HK-1]GBF11909.1 prolyl tripeptidyl peptidase precursor [Tepidibacillus sp. HK-1]
MISFPKPDVEQFFRTYVISQFAISKDESKLIFSTNMNGKFNLWAMDLPQTYPYPLTYHDQNSSFIKIDPKNRFFLTGFDHDGDENYQIYALPIEGGKPFPILTGDRKEKYFFAELSKDGERLYYMTSKENPNFLDARLYNLVTKEDQLLFQGDETTTYLVTTSPEEKSYVYIKMYANTYVVAYVKVGDEVFCLTPSPEKVHTATDALYIDESTIYFVTNFEEEFSYVASFNLETKEFATILKLKKEDVTGIKWHEKTRTLYIVTEKGVTDQFYAYQIDNKILTPINTPVDNIQQFTVADSGNLYLLGRSATRPFNIFKREENGEWHPLTDNRVLGVPESDMVDPEVVRYPSFDGLEIEALLFKAKPEVANGYTIFWPHGGPQAAERKFFRGLFQFLLGRGYTIFAPNFRGSTGYGASFTKLVEGDWGEGPRLDCVAGIEWLFDQGISARDKLFVVGGSYGGYMTLLLAGRHPEYFRAAVDIFGPNNLFTFIDSVPEHWKPIMTRWLGDPEVDKERLTKDSPITYLNQMTKPMLVIQGANDPRVVKAESDQIVASLREKGVEVEYLVLEDEGHGFSKKENEIKVNRLILDFLERHQ